MSKNRLGYVLSTFFALTIFNTVVHASCRSNMSSYAASAGATTDYTVHIGIESPSRTCDSSEKMLRQNVATGEVVQLADYCANGEFVDECVPQGEYRYGLTIPFDCSEAGTCNGLSYYATVNVFYSPPSDCVRTAGNGPPIPYSGQVPWASAKDGYIECPNTDAGGCGCSVKAKGTKGTTAALLLTAIALWRRRIFSRRRG